MTDPALRDALRELPCQIATTVYLADAQGYRYAEIAEITGVPLGTVMSRLHRGRKRLRALLADRGLLLLKKPAAGGGELPRSRSE